MRSDSCGCASGGEGLPAGASRRSVIVMEIRPLVEPESSMDLELSNSGTMWPIPAVDRSERRTPKGGASCESCRDRRWRTSTWRP